MRITNNKKAPDGRPSDQSARELIQAQNITVKKDCQIPPEILLELAAMQTRFKEIGRSYGLADIGSNYIQLTPGSFLDTFSEFAVNILPGMLYPEELSTEHYGVKFICVR